MNCITVSRVFYELHTVSRVLYELHNGVQSSVNYIVVCFCYTKLFCVLIS